MKLALLIIAVILFAALFFPLLPSLVKDWIETPDYSHGFLIPLLSIYFLWRKRDELKSTEIIPSGKGVFIILAGLILFVLARIGFQLFLQDLSMLIVLFGLIYAQAGKEMAKKVAFPIAYLIFMIPLPSLILTTITFHLGLLSTKLAYFSIKVLGISATRAGNIINLETCSLVVAAPCSGLRSLIVFMAASLAIGYLFQKTIKNRIMLFFIAIILAVLMNTIRLAVTAIFADTLKLKAIPMTIHDRTGIVVVILGFIILYWISDLLAKKK